MDNGSWCAERSNGALLTFLAVFVSTAELRVHLTKGLTVLLCRRNHHYSQLQCNGKRNQRQPGRGKRL